MTSGFASPPAQEIMRASRGSAGQHAAMNFTKNIGMLLLAIYLILLGLIGIFGISLGGLGILLPILALAAGIFILIGR